MGHLTNENTLAFYCIENMGIDQPAHTIHSDQYLCFPPVESILDIHGSV